MPIILTDEKGEGEGIRGMKGTGGGGGEGERAG